MASEKLARRYATAIFMLAEERDAVARVGDDLAQAQAAIGEGLAFEFFVAPVIGRPDKERVLEQTFEGKLDEIALHALLLLVRKRREALLGTIVSEYRKLQLAALGEERLTVTSARPLEGTELQAMVERLERHYQKKFQVQQVVDPDLIGGVRILMGDRRIDGTVSGTLENLARTLFATN
jgi:F-type H+-transporting ATPase subunit delta